MEISDVTVREKETDTEHFSTIKCFSCKIGFPKFCDGVEKKNIHLLILPI
jgi:hypothetical protein